MTSLFGAVWCELGMSMDERWAEQHVQVLDKMFENAAAVQAHKSTAAGDAEGSNRYEGHVSHLAWILVCFLIGTTMSYNNDGTKDKSDTTDRIENTTAKDYYIRSFEQFCRQHKDGDDVCTLAATSWRLRMAALTSKLKPSMNKCCSAYSTEVLSRMASILPRIPTPKECDYEDDGEVYWYWALDCTASAVQHINTCDQVQQRDFLGNKEILKNMKNLVCQVIKVVGEVSKRGGGGTTAAAALSFLKEVWTLDSTLFVSAQQLEQLLPHLEKYTTSSSNRGGGKNSSQSAGVAALKLADMYAVFASPSPAALLFAYGFQQPPIDSAIPHLAFEHYKKYIQACDGPCVTAVLPSHMLSTNNGGGGGGAVQVDIALEVKKQIEQFVKRCPDGSSENKDMNLATVDNGKANRWAHVLREKSKYATIDQAAVAAAAAATARREEEEEEKEGINGEEEIRVGWLNVMKAVVDFESIVAGSEYGKVTSGVATDIKTLSCRLGRLV